MVLYIGIEERGSTSFQYRVISEEAIGRLLIAGILPGLVLTAIYSVGITIMVRRKPELVMAAGGNAFFG